MPVVADRWFQPATAALLRLKSPVVTRRRERSSWMCPKRSRPLPPNRRRSQGEERHVAPGARSAPARTAARRRRGRCEPRARSTRAANATPASHVLSRASLSPLRMSWLTHRMCTGCGLRESCPALREKCTDRRRKAGLCGLWTGTCVCCGRSAVKIQDDSMPSAP